MTDAAPSAWLFSNGNALFLNEADGQIPELQAAKWAGVHEFRDRYPDAPIYVTNWRDKTAVEVGDEVLEFIEGDA